MDRKWLCISSRAVVRDFPGCSMHGSLPCAPWTLWNFMNVAKYGESFKKKLDKSRNKPIIMLSHFSLLLRISSDMAGVFLLSGPGFLPVGP